MRLAHHDTQWMLDGDKVAGIILGYDFCAEHECSVRGIRSGFGVFEGAPLGFEQRKVTRVPEQLIFHEYSRKPKDRRRKALVPAAILCYENAHWRSGQELLDYAKGETSFFFESGERWYEPRHDIVCAWDGRSFAIHVRGAENVARLMQLYEAFRACDVVVSNPTSLGFLRNGGLAFGMLSAISDETKAKVREADEAAARLEAAVVASGIRDELKAAGKGWYALSPAWFGDETTQQLQFFLNPQEQRKYNSGWFLLGELREWARGGGPVIKHELVDAYAAANSDWNSIWYKRFEAAGVPLGRILSLTVKDGEVAVLVRVTPGDRSGFASGCYTLPELDAKLPVVQTTERA